MTKSKILFLCISLIICNLKAQNSNYKITDKSITFKVSNVEQAENLVDETSYQVTLEYCLGTKLESFQLSEENKTLIPVDAHGFVAALHICFAEHRPMTIAPDMIWLMICQGVAMHVEQNSDTLRHLFVDFRGKKDIIIRRDNFVKGDIHNDWLNVFPEFSDSVRSYLKDSLYQLVVPKFSTTGIKEKAAYEITFLSAVKRYFNYYTETLCGIPEITLEGKTEDWIWLRKNAEKFRKYHLDNWINNLIPILDEFINASEGKIDQKFWRSIYKCDDECGGPFITGWIVKFFPYLVRANNMIYYNELIEGNKFLFRGLIGNHLPTGLSKADFKWIYRVPGQFADYSMEMYAGFIGISQNKQSKALRPEIGWAIIDAKKSLFEERYDTIKTVEETNDSTAIEPYRLVSKDTSPKIFWRYKTNQCYFSLRPIETYSLFVKNGKAGKYQDPIFFPEIFDSAYDSYIYLKKYIKKEIGLKKYFAKIVFDVSWLGTIENIRVNSEKYPELNDRIVEILKVIPCKAGTYNDQEVSFRINIIDKQFKK